MNKSSIFLTVGCFLFTVSFIFYRRATNLSLNFGLSNSNNLKVVEIAPPHKIAEGAKSMNKQDFLDMKKDLVDLFDDDEMLPYSPPSKSNNTKIIETSHIIQFENFLKPFHDNITSTRKKLLSWLETDTFNDLLPVKTVANGYKDGFFQKVMSVNAISTVVLWADDISQFKNILPDKYYDYVASNCRDLENHAIYGERFAKTAYNATCFDTLDNLWKPKPLGITPFGMGLPDKGVSTLRKIWNKPKGVPATYLLVIKDAVTVSSGDVWVGSTKIVIQRCYQDLKPKLPYKWRQAKLYKEIFVIMQYFGGSFFHFHVEGLPRLMPYLKWLEDNPHIPILIQKPKYNNAFEGFLKVTKIPRERFVTDKIVRAKILYMPAGGICGRSNLFGTVATSLYVKSRFASLPTGKPDSVVFIKRSSSGRLWINHETIFSQVKKEVERRGLKMVLFTDRPAPSFEESIKIFSKAVLIVGPHGAGFSHILWSRPGTVLIEGLCNIIPNKVNLCYRNLAQMLGMRWYGIFRGCVPTSPNQVTPIVTFYLDKYLESLSKGF